MSSGLSQSLLSPTGGKASLRTERLGRLRGLYAIVVDGTALAPLALVDAVLRGGARVVQLRLKQAGTGEFLQIAREAVLRCRARGALLIVNDRPDVARLAAADGVHLGQEDLTIEAARQVVGEHALIGVSTHGEEEIDAALAAGADYLGFGPIFTTSTKSATAPGARPLPPPHGVAGLIEAVVRARGTPLVAIGGITARNAGELARSGAACVAAIGEICGAPDPSDAARVLRETFSGRLATGSSGARVGR